MTDATIAVIMAVGRARATVEEQSMYEEREYCSSDPVPHSLRIKTAFSHRSD